MSSSWRLAANQALRRHGGSWIASSHQSRCQTLLTQPLDGPTGRWLPLHPWQPRWQWQAEPCLQPQHTGSTESAAVSSFSQLSHTSQQHQMNTDPRCATTPWHHLPMCPSRPPPLPPPPPITSTVMAALARLHDKHLSALGRTDHSLPVSQLVRSTSGQSTPLHAIQPMTTPTSQCAWDWHRRSSSSNTAASVSATSAAGDISSSMSNSSAVRARAADPSTEVGNAVVSHCGSDSRDEGESNNGSDSSMGSSVDSGGVVSAAAEYSVAVKSFCVGRSLDIRGLMDDPHFQPLLHHPVLLPSRNTIIMRLAQHEGHKTVTGQQAEPSKDVVDGSVADSQQQHLTTQEQQEQRHKQTQQQHQQQHQQQSQQQPQHSLAAPSLSSPPSSSPSFSSPSSSSYPSSSLSSLIPAPSSSFPPSPSPSPPIEVGSFLVAFHYGAAVLFNADPAVEAAVLQRIAAHSVGPFASAHRDEYVVIVRPGLASWSEGGLDHVVVRQLDTDNLRVISSILAQSVALDFYARKVDAMVTTFGELNAGMEQTGSFTMTRKKLFQLVAAANTTLTDVILRIGLLERSDTAWKSARYSAVWEFLRDDFELDERFESLDFKLNIIQHNVRFFLDVLQNRKSDTLEWIIILLITGEICVSLYDIYRGACNMT